MFTLNHKLLALSKTIVATNAQGVKLFAVKHKLISKSNVTTSLLNSFDEEPAEVLNDGWTDDKAVLTLRNKKIAIIRRNSIDRGNADYVSQNVSDRSFGHIPKAPLHSQDNR